MPVRPETASTGTTEELLAALTDLQQNSADRINSRRGRTRIDADCLVSVYPGNVSDRNGLYLKGTCRDISSTGCRLMMTGPMNVGDIFLMALNRASIDLDPIYGRCVRCQMIREDTYECGFAFFAPIELPDQQPKSDLDLG